MLKWDSPQVKANIYERDKTVMSFVVELNPLPYLPTPEFYK